MKLLKIFGFIFLGIFLIILSIPQITYTYYNIKIEKPDPPKKITISEEDALNLWENNEKNREIRFEELGPYKFVYSFARMVFLLMKNEGVVNKDRAFPYGSRLILIVIRNSMYDYLIKESILTKVLSEYTLAIWISRNWTEKQILEKLMEIENMEVNREYYFDRIAELLNTEELPDRCLYCFNKDHKQFFRLIKEYREHPQDYVKNKKEMMEICKKHRNFKSVEKIINKIGSNTNAQSD